MAFLFILLFILTLNAGNHMLIPHLLLHNILSAEVEQSCHCPVLHFLCPLSSSHKEFKNKKMHRNGCLTQNQKALHCYVRLLSILRFKRCLYLLKINLLQWAHNKLTQIQVWWSHHVIYKSKFCTPAFWPSPCYQCVWMIHKDSYSVQSNPIPSWISTWWHWKEKTLLVRTKPLTEQGKWPQPLGVRAERQDKHILWKRATQ